MLKWVSMGLLVLFGGVVLQAQQTRTLYDLVREQNPRQAELSLTISGMLPQPDLAQLMREADLVVEGIIDRTSVRITRDDSAAETVLELVIERVLHSKLRITGNFHRFQVVQIGGDVEIEGTLVHVQDSALPPFVAGRRQIFFLKQHPQEQEGVFYIPYGPYGTFDVRDRQVYSFRNNQRVFALREGSANDRKFDGDDIDAFAAALQAVR